MSSQKKAFKTENNLEFYSTGELRNVLLSQSMCEVVDHLNPAKYKQYKSLLNSV